LAIGQKSKPRSAACRTRNHARFAQKIGTKCRFLQIRNACDAVYESDIEPWSEWLMGQQGLSPGYDPLAFAIQECRKRGLEIHAWLNPYRAVTDIQRASIAPNHVTKLHPDWIRQYGNLRILDPGMPEVRNYVTTVVLDVLRRYDVDGIHFDDYFYPYPQTGIALNDKATFSRHSRGFTNKADWRRDNVDLLVQMVSENIKKTKPWVKFGISPFGIWQNRSSSAEGSDTKGLESYSATYSDSKYWLQQNWVDYVVPQIYWTIGNSTANFAVLAPWWNANANGRHVYVGHATYKVNTDSDWRSSNQTPNQIQMARSLSNITGSVFFSAKTLKNGSSTLSESIKTLFENHALPPTMPWKDNIPPASPINLTAQLANDNKINLSWSYINKSDSELDKAKNFVVYRFENNEPVVGGNSRNIKAVLPYLSNSQTITFIDSETQAGINYKYVVTALDRLSNESSPSAAASPTILTSVEEKQAIIIAKKVEQPSEKIDTDFQIFPNPFNEQMSIRYILQKNSNVSLYVYDERGARVGVLIDDEKKSEGTHSVIFNGEFLSEGTYFARLNAGNGIKTAKIVLAR
jgi:uncharacterized lipoprotein YddW (UPF0748 family)